MKKPVISRIVPLVAILALILLLFGFRYLGFVDANFANLAPVSAMALCFGLFFRRSVLAVVIAFAALVLSDVFVTVLAVRQDPNLSFWALMVSPTVLLRYAVYGCLFAVACFWTRRKHSSHCLGLDPCHDAGVLRDHEHGSMVNLSRPICLCQDGGWLVAKPDCGPTDSWRAPKLFLFEKRTHW